jgi:catechol 2,3-dioxygenase-like lactoylglutathione lyase family enzyme
MRIKTANTIFYCRKWEETVLFYRDHLKLSVNFATDWFVEFRVTETARLSIADETRASIKSCHGKGVTLSLEVENIDRAWEHAEISKLKPTSIKKHSWDARIFHLFDPEGHRIEFWEKSSGLK